MPVIQVTVTVVSLPPTLGVLLLLVTASNFCSSSSFFAFSTFSFSSTLFFPSCVAKSWERRKERGLASTESSASPSRSRHVPVRDCLSQRQRGLVQDTRPRPQRWSVLSPWSVLCDSNSTSSSTSRHHFLLQRSSTVVEGFCEGHPHGHPLVSQPRAEPAVPAPLCRASTEIAMQRHVDPKGSCDSSPTNMSNLSEPLWWLWFGRGT